MAQYNTAENLETLALTGNNSNLLSELKANIEEADRIDIIVSFLMESGVRLILDELKEAVNRGVKLRILTGNYLNITEPAALYLLKQELGDKIDLRFFNNPNLSFHPKSYIFHKENFDEIFIGSSNLSKTALTLGIEWNYKFNSLTDSKASADFNQNFIDLFENHAIPITDDILKEYSRTYKKPQFLPVETLPDGLIKPRGVQVEALYSLENLRKEGVNKALVQAATGVGKTYLAGFDSLKFPKVLFVAHREEILKQAYESFKNIREGSSFGFFNATKKEADKDVVFASIQSLSIEGTLENSFKPDQFDYIVIDEFHHAQAKSYRKVLDYFTPKFLLGLTATPERTDGRSIFELLDYNVAYEIGLPEAIEKGLLVPFHYYGIYDETDYSEMKFVKGDYRTEDLNVAYIGNIKRDKLIIDNYRKHYSSKAIGFCSSVEHANYMAEIFTKHDIPSCSVTSKNNSDYSMDRENALKELEEGNIEVIFSVDMFNEGLDIPGIDLVMFLRPTESSIIFLQQLGRGLRKAENKEYLTVLDFIGNYKNAGRFTNLLTSEKNSINRSVHNLVTDNRLFPAGCIIDFDLALIDVIDKMEKKRLKKKELIRGEFYRIKEELGRVPSRFELFTNLDAETIEIIYNNPKLNPFQNYLGFLKELGELSENEENLKTGIGADFLNIIETTRFTRSYKIPVLKAFVGDNEILDKVDLKRILKEWKVFFERNQNYKDIKGLKDIKEFKEKDDSFHLGLIKKNPVHYLTTSEEGYFIDENGSVKLNENLKEYLKNPTFIKHYKDILEFREKDYYYRRYRKRN